MANPPPYRNSFLPKQRKKEYPRKLQEGEPHHYTIPKLIVIITANLEGKRLGVAVSGIAQLFDFIPSGVTGMTIGEDQITFIGMAATLNHVCIHPRGGSNVMGEHKPANPTTAVASEGATI